MPFSALFLGQSIPWLPQIAHLLSEVFALVTTPLSPFSTPCAPSWSLTPSTSRYYSTCYIFDFFIEDLPVPGIEALWEKDFCFPLFTAGSTRPRIISVTSWVLRVYLLNDYMETEFHSTGLTFLSPPPFRPSLQLGENWSPCEPPSRPLAFAKVRVAIPSNR